MQDELVVVIFLTWGGDIMKYDIEFFETLLNPHERLSLGNMEYLDELNELADKFMESGSIEGKIAAVAIYHQLSEHMVCLLINYSIFFIQCSIFPVEYPEWKQKKNSTAGQLLDRLEGCLDFEHKDAFIKKTRELNKRRNETMHGLTKHSSIEQVSLELSTVKNLFDEIYESFDSARDWFFLCYKDFRKDRDWSDMLDEYQDELDASEFPDTELKRLVELIQRCG